MSNRTLEYEIKDIVQKGVKFLGAVVLNVCGVLLNNVIELGASDATEAGVKKAVAALYDAKVSDNEILRVVSIHWNISYQEVERYLIDEKRMAAIRSLKQYLLLQGYSRSEIDVFMSDNRAAIIIRNEKELWKLKDSPEKLFKAIQSRNKSK